MLSLAVILLLVMVLNIPFGYWRANVKKFSLPWFLAVHLPVPLVAYMRSQFHLGWLVLMIFLFVVAYFTGQSIGVKISTKMRKHGKVTSSLIHDLIRRSRLSLSGR